MSQPPNGPQQPPQGQWGPLPPPGYGPPPGPPGQQQYGQWGPPPKKKSHTTRNVILAVVGVLIVIGIISAAASGGSSKKAAAPAPSHKTSTGNSNPLQHPEDVAIASCSNDELGFADAKVVVTNHSSKPSTYAVEVAFESKDGSQQVGTGNAFIDQLAPGQKSVATDASSAQSATAGSYTCKVVDATRTASQ